MTTEIAQKTRYFCIFDYFLDGVFLVLPNLLCKPNKDFFAKERDRQIKDIPGLTFAEASG